MEKRAVEKALASNKTPCLWQVWNLVCGLAPTPWHFLQLPCPSSRKPASQHYLRKLAETADRLLAFEHVW